MTPHVPADGPYLENQRFEIVRDKFLRFEAGRPLRYVVDKAHWH